MTMAEGAKQKREDAVSNYEETYRYLLRPERFGQLRELMEEQNVYASLNVKDILLKNEDFPYILFEIEADQIFAAQMVGLLLDIDALMPGYAGDYYLPVIAMARNYDPEINRLIHLENSLAHELLHIRDMLSLIESDPSYIRRLKRYGMNAIRKAKDLKGSIDFEVSKIFHLEQQAFESDFDRGERMIMTMFLGRVLEYECGTKQEYIEMKISD